MFVLFKYGIQFRILTIFVLLSSISANHALAEASKPSATAIAKPNAASKAAQPAASDWDALLKSAWQLNLSSETEAANAKAQEALQIAEKKLDSKGIISCLDVKADIFDSQGKLPEQEELRKRALALAESKFGKTSPEYARHLAKLGAWYARKGEQGQARSHIEEATQILGNSESKYPHEMAVCQLALGRRLVSEGSFGLADDAYSKALQLQDNSGSPELFEVLQISREYAALLDQLGRKPESEKLKDRINLVKAGSGLSDPSKKASTACGGSSGAFLKIVEEARANSKDREKCMALWKQALQEAEKAGNDKKIAFVLIHLADEYRAAKQNEEAISLLKRGLSLREKAGANETLGMARNLSRLAQVYMSSNKVAESESLLRKAADIESKCQASDTMRANTLQYLVSAAMLNKNNRQTEEAAQQLITISDKIGGSAGVLHKRTAQSMLGSVYMQTGRMNDGMRVMKEVSASMNAVSPAEMTKTYMDEFNESDKLVDESEIKDFS